MGGGNIFTIIHARDGMGWDRMGYVSTVVKLRKLYSRGSLRFNFRR